MTIVLTTCVFIMFYRILQIFLVSINFINIFVKKFFCKRVKGNWSKEPPRCYSPLLGVSSNALLTAYPQRNPAGSQNIPAAHCWVHTTARYMPQSRLPAHL